MFGRKIVAIWTLLWLSRRVIICTEQRSIYISTFPNALISKKRHKSWDKYRPFDKRDRSSVSRTALNLRFKMRRFPNKAHKRAESLQTEIIIPSLILGEDKKGGFLALDFRQWWHYVKTIYCNLKCLFKNCLLFSCQTNDEFTIVVQLCKESKSAIYGNSPVTLVYSLLNWKTKAKRWRSGVEEIVPSRILWVKSQVKPRINSRPFFRNISMWLLPTIDTGTRRKYCLARSSVNEYLLRTKFVCTIGYWRHNTQVKNSPYQ